MRGRDRDKDQNQNKLKYLAKTCKDAYCALTYSRPTCFLHVLPVPV